MQKIIYCCDLCKKETHKAQLTQLILPKSCCTFKEDKWTETIECCTECLIQISTILDKHLYIYQNTVGWEKNKRADD